MPHHCPSMRRIEISIAMISAGLFLLLTGTLLANPARQASLIAQESGPPPQTAGPQSQQPSPQEPQAPAPQAPPPQYDKAIFQPPIPGDQLAFLKQFDGAAAKNLDRDKQFRKLMHSVIPNCTFHYGWDMPLSDALDLVLKGSPEPVRIRDGRYLMVSGSSGPYLAGRGFMWIDLQDGVALGGFYFRPTNGEPTPTVNIFSKQVKEEALAMSQLPPTFYQDLLGWSVESRIPPVTPRYFITGSNRKILLEHDEDYCATVGRILVAPAPACEQMNADAADTDLNAAYYLEQTHHATNATAWMITGADMVAFLQFREDSCRGGPDPLRCRIRLTREHSHTIIHPRAGPHPAHK